MEKRIFIHVGPPKTGTSALQKWLNENHDFLNTQKICYPSHHTDKNGISSGNILSIYSRNNNNSLYLDQSKVLKLIDEFNNSKFEILLLSSEFFFIRIDEIKETIPQAKIICYIRNPMSKRESLYNQGIKRASITHKQPSTIKRKIPDLELINDAVKKYSLNDIVIRLYGDAFFYHGNIVSDILNIFEIDHKAELTTINNSYQFEALELKRWLNNFTLDLLKNDIDYILQTYSEGTSEYSLLRPMFYRRQTGIDIKILKLFLDNNKINQSDLFIQTIESQKQKKYHKQSLNRSSFINVSQYLNNRLTPEVKRKKLLNIIQSSNYEDEYTSIFIDIFKTKKTMSLLAQLKSVFQKGS